MAGENINRRLNIYINDKEVVNSMGGVTRAITKTKNEMRALVKGSENYDSELKRLGEQLSTLTEHQNDFRAELELTNNEMGAARETFLSFFSALASGDLMGVQTGLLAIRASITATAKAAWAFIATPLGSFIAGLVVIGSVTKEWLNYNDAVYKANKLTSSITKIAKENVDAVRLQAEAIAETFDQDFTKVLETARALVNEFGVSYEDALARIENGLVKGGAANDEFLSSMKEYPTFFAAAGYSVEEFQNLVNSGIDLGVYDDKLPDAIKEFALSVNEQTKGVRDGLRNAFGSEFTDKLLKGVKDGTITVKEALALVSDEAERIGLNAQQAQQLTADLFRGAGEDAGGALKIFEAVRESIKNQIEPLTEAENAQQQLADSALEVAKAQDRAFNSEGYAKWKVAAMSALNTIKSGFYDLIFQITNSNEALAALRDKQTEDAGVKQNTTDQIKNFEGYVALRKKSMGDLFDFETVREERLATIRAQYAKTAGSWDLTPAQENQQKKLEAEMEAIKKYQVKATQIKNKNSADDQDAAKKLADENAKKRAKELEDAQKHAEDLLKLEADLQKQLLATKRAAGDLKDGLIKDDYAREKALINGEYDKKIEDLELNIKKEQEAIDKLKKGIASPKTSTEDLTSFKKQLKDRLAIQENYNAAMLLTDQTRDLKLGALQEKFLQKSIQDQEKENARAIQNLQTKHNNEFAEIKTLQQAKSILSKYLSAEELKEVHTLEDAKKKVRQQFQNEELTLQQKHLTDLVAQMNTKLGEVDQFGISLISPEEREIILKFLDEAAAKLSVLGMSKSENNPDKVDESKDIKSLSGLDILGFTPEQWQNTFDSLDTFSEKIAAVEMVVGAVKNAFGVYFQFLEAGEKRSMQKFETNNRKKQADLSDQLEKGYITQEVYTARKAKLDQELAKKKAEIEYKQAKREKLMNIASIIANTAVGVSKALAQGGMVFGVPFAGIVAALGGLQLIAAVAQPLPDKNGFYDGGFTGTGNPRGEAGPVHFNEYVVPQKVLFSNDPVMPNIMGYLEAKRQGKQPQLQEEPNPIASNSQTAAAAAGSDLYPAVVNALNRNSEILEKIEEDGVPAYLVDDIKTARKMRNRIKELEKLEKTAKV